MPKQSRALTFSKKLLALVGVSTLALSTAFAADQPPANLDQLFGIKEAPKPLPAGPAPTPDSLMPSATLNTVKAETTPVKAAPTQQQPAIRDPKEDKLWQMLEQAPPPAVGAPATTPTATPAASQPAAVDAIANSPRAREEEPMNHRAPGMVSPPSAVPPIDQNGTSPLEAAPAPAALPPAAIPVEKSAAHPVKKAKKAKALPVAAPAEKPAALVVTEDPVKTYASPKKAVAKPAKIAVKAKPKPEKVKVVAPKPIAEKPHKVATPLKKEHKQSAKPLAKPASLLEKSPVVKRSDVLAATLAFTPFHSVMPAGVEAQLQDIANTLKQDTARTIELRGYADWTPNGSLEATDYLAEKRATIVKEYLQTQGISATRIKVVGKGYDYAGGVPRDRVEVVLQ